MRKINKIVMHCSDSDFGNVNIIRKWHLARKFNDIGYHYVILSGFINVNFERKILNGSIECGRFEDIVGAHVEGNNSDSIGICLIGANRFTKEQFFSLKLLILELCEVYSLTEEDVFGHYELDKRGKTCPNIDMDILRDFIFGNNDLLSLHEYLKGI